jgi:hypothetical protein
VTLPNQPPVAAPDAAATTAGTAVTIDVLANDSDPDGDSLRLAGMSLPGHGTLALAPGQRFLYTPAAGFIGSDSFTYSVRDSKGARATGTVSVEVDRANTAPAAVPDSAATSGEPVTLDLLANDNDPDGDPLQLAGLTLPVGGQITVNPDRTVTYAPAAGFSGTDSFTYTVSDGEARSEADVTVTVTATSLPTFANGYRYRRRLVVPARATQAQTVADFVLLVREQDDRLKPVAAGGRVESAAGHDIRFEFEDGTKLDHELERYDPLTGSIVAWVRVPSWQLAQRLAVLLYYGKPGLAATEANPAGAWRDRMRVGDDCPRCNPQSLIQQIRGDRRCRPPTTSTTRQPPPRAILPEFWFRWNSAVARGSSLRLHRTARRCPGTKSKAATLRRSWSYWTYSKSGPRSASAGRYRL